MRNTEIIRSEQTDDSCLYCKHPSGLDIYIKEMEGFNSAFALFATKYGSINTRFRLRGEADYAEVPEGIAHFLEHKLFENEDCDAFEQYARTGANANAFTSFDQTAYLFGCSEHFNDSLRILLNTVQNPYFTQETVDKEQGIIAQEIRMNDDNPGWRVFFGMLRAMFHNHPVRIDIAGTVESIREIDAELLYRCYNTFYNLHNMTLCIAGNVRAEEALAVCDELLRPCEDHGLEQLYAEEPEDIVTAFTEEHMPVGTPLFNFGFKLRPREGREAVRTALVSSMLLETLLGASSPFYNDALHEGLLNSEFDVDAPFYGDGYFVVSCGGETAQPELVRDRILQVLETAKREGFDRETFERLKKVRYGDLIRSSNNVEASANGMMRSWMRGIGIFDDAQLLASVTYEDAMQLLREELDPQRAVLSVIR